MKSTPPPRSTPVLPIVLRSTEFSDIEQLQHGLDDKLLNIAESLRLLAVPERTRTP